MQSEVFISLLEKKIGETLPVFLQREYVNNKKSSYVVGDMLGVSGTFIRKCLQQYNISSRGLQEAVSLQRGGGKIDNTLTEVEEQVIRGSLMGDGTIQTRNCVTGAFKETHGLKQESYLQWKSHMLSRLEPIFKYGESQSKYKCCYIRTKSLKSLYQIYKEYYVDTKTVTRNTLKRLNPLGIAVWYQDDGSWLGGGLCLCTHCFSVVEQETMIDYFKDIWNIKVEMRWTAPYHTLNAFGKARGQRYPFLRILKKQVGKFIDLVQPHIHSSMLYKIGSKNV